jgi:hypothetical protein
VKKVASFGAFLFSVAAGNRAIMLDEASIITAIRRPGYDTSSRVKVVYGSASAMTKNGRPARNSSSVPWRTRETHDGRLHARTAGSATCVRPAFRRVAARTISTARLMLIRATSTITDASRCAYSKSATGVFRHSKIVSRMSAGTAVTGTTRGSRPPV